MYRKPNILMSLMMLVSIGIAAAIPALAETTEEDGGSYFKGAMATCLSRAKVVYPCVSLSPPSYQTGSTSTFVSDVAAGPYLPLDSEVRERNWLVKLKAQNFWNSKWSLSPAAQGMDMDFSLDRSGAGMHMNLGPMKFNVFVDEERFSDSRIFLGIDRSW
jgi:hypothetical protein